MSMLFENLTKMFSGIWRKAKKEEHEKERKFGLKEFPRPLSKKMELNMLSDFYIFCKEKVYTWSIGISIILSYGLLIGTTVIGIDDESLWEYVEGGAFIEQDRVGEWIIQKIFSSYALLPWWTATVGLLFLFGGILLWLYAIDKKLNGNFSKGMLTIAGMIFVSFPYIAKSYVFYGNIITMGYVFCLTAIASYLAYSIWDIIRLKQIIMLLISLGGGVYI